uniref:Butyrophilin subfamily 1 member A1-like n=1 Tax=Anser cygnoides TaxID=8845 RepID=A0A8B9E6U6_ANSCY
MHFLSFFHYFVTCVMMLLIHKPEADGFAVPASSHPVLAAVGGAAVLPCCLHLGASARPSEVSWLRMPRSSLVHHYCEQKGQDKEQTPEYRGRTELLMHRIRQGCMDLRLSAVRPSDEGQYTCVVRSGISDKEARLELKVTAMGSAPHISMENIQGGIRIVCRSSGWYPEPQVLWRDSSHQHIPSETENRSRDARGLFEAQSTLLVMGSTPKDLSCVVRNTYLNEEKETAFQMSDFLQGAYPGVVVPGVILTVFGVIGFIAYLLKIKGWRRFADKLGKANMTLDPDTAHPWLLLSKDGKGVRWGAEWQKRPEGPERFDTWCCVLGYEGFTSGQHTWEVTVDSAKSWGVGLARASLQRKGRIPLSPQEGLWAVVKLDKVFRALTSPECTPLPLTCIPRRIRISLDYEKGQVAFSNADTDVPIFTFLPASFKGERIHLWLWLGVWCNARVTS